MAYLTLRLEQGSSLPFRGVSSAMKLFYEEEKIDRAPSHETCIQWDLKVGLFKLLRTKQQSIEWSWIIDHVLGEGQVKCLAVFGVPSTFLSESEDLTLSLTDLEPFGLIPMSHTTGKDVKDALIQISNRTGIVPRTIVSDHGADLWFGVKEFCKEKGNRTTEHYDICHKVAVELKKCFEKDPDWEIFRAKAAHTKRLLFNTTGVGFAPPNQRKKARYQNVDILISWANKALDFKEQIPTKMREKLNWVYEYQDKIKVWTQWVLIAKHAREEIRYRGFGEGAEERLAKRLAPIQMTKASEDLVSTLLNFVSFESRKLLEGEKVIGSTEVIESLFGRFKRIKAGVYDKHGGIGRLILTMASRVGEISMEIVETALESIRTVDVNNWLSAHLLRNAV